MKLKAAGILMIVALAFTSVYLLNRYFRKVIKRGESVLKFFLYIISAFALVFAYFFAGAFDKKAAS